MKEENKKLVWNLVGRHHLPIKNMPFTSCVDVLTGLLDLRGSDGVQQQALFNWLFKLRVTKKKQGIP